ncbi:hypothetical protein [Peptacetobacter hiranonis]|uniref:hypothetical protein n=1 Tax=Peptacetobacter hiranonis TaxID=89152 RepID=UPI0015B7D69A|nr:hypothetical protein [Peptacetobacter hiranonis]
MMFDEKYLKNMTTKDWERATKFGIKYLVEMNVDPSLVYSGETCALIGLLTGSEGLYLSMQNWIDDIISDELGAHPVKVLTLNGMRFLDPQDTDILMEATEKKLISTAISKGLFPANIKSLFPIFLEKKSLVDLFENPSILV